MAGTWRLLRWTLTNVETRATFRLFGSEGLTAAAVTRRLGIEPTRAVEAGDRVGRRPNATRASSTWLLSSSPGIEEGVELAVQLHRVLAVLEPVTAALWDLVRDGYEANWFCYVASHVTEHSVELDRQLMRQLLALPGDLWLDVCGDDFDSEGDSRPDSPGYDQDLPRTSNAPWRNRG
jgi:Domain of unknown function (DUF4279)